MKKLPILLCILLATAGVALARRAEGGPSREDAAKADYIFLEALRAKSQGHLDAAYDLLERAYSLNPSDNETALELAPFLLNFPDSASRERAIAMMGAYYADNPSDYQVGARYGLLLDRLDRKREALDVWEKLHAFYPERTEISNVLAEGLAHTGEAEDARRAIGIYDSVELAEGPSMQLSTNKIQIFYLRGDTAAILAEADRLRQARPTSSDFNVFSGDIYNMFGKPDRAVDFYDRAIELDPSSGYAYFSKANFYKSQGDSAGYDREVFMALKQDNLNVDTKLNILRSYIQEMYADSLQRPRIRQLFDTLVVQHPLEHPIRGMYAAYLTDARDFAAAAEQEEQALGLNPADPDGWDLLSSLYIQTDDYDRAEDAIMRAMHYYPDEPSQHFKLGSLYAMKKEYDRSLAQYGKALELTDSTDVNAISALYTSMADNLYQLGRADSAFTLYDKALVYNPDNLLAMNNCAYFMACNDIELDRALAMIEKVVAADPENPTDLDTYAWVLFKRKDYAKAREVIDKALGLDPEPGAEILEHAGDIYFMDREPAEAVEFWKKALKLDPANESLKLKVKNKNIYH